MIKPVANKLKLK